MCAVSSYSVTLFETGKQTQMESTFSMNEPAEVQVLSRWKAAGIHLAISIAIALAVIATMLFLWYPTPYFQAMGGGGLLMLVTGVDVVLGPLITLIIFNTKKKSLKFDLMCVAIVQILALAYGVSTMFQARPVYTVFSKDRFDVIIAADTNAKERAKVTDVVFKSLPLTGPQIAAMVTPNDMKEVQRMLVSGISERAFSQYYVAYDSKAKEAATAAKPLTQIQKNNPAAAEKLKSFLTTKALDESKVGFLPLYTRNEDMTVVLDKETGKILAIAPVAP
jgi:hypothetical protein